VEEAISTDFGTRIGTLETASSDHEGRIAALETAIAGKADSERTRWPSTLVARQATGTAVRWTFSRRRSS